MISIGLLLHSTLSFSRVPDISSVLFLPAKQINDISFEIKSKQITDLLKEKSTKVNVEDFKAVVYKHKENIDVEIKGIKKVDPKIQEKLIGLIKDKAQIFLGTELLEWLLEYEYIEEKSGWYIYQDKTEVLDVAEIKIKYGPKMIKVIEKKPTGTLRTHYTLKKRPWSGGKSVITEVERKIYEGNQALHIKTKLNYQQINQTYLLSNLEVVTKQQVNLGTDNKIEREIIENYDFTNISMAQGHAKEWFVLQKK